MPNRLGPNAGGIGVAHPVMAGLRRWLGPSSSPRLLIGVG
jgi:hypothetical protein